MSDTSLDSESAHSSQCDSEYNYIPGYIMEDGSNDASGEIGTLEAVDSKILGDYNSWRAQKELVRTIFKKYLRSARNKLRCSNED